MKLNISENIRKNRRENNLSQEIFAERMGVSFQTISKWERGECYPDIEMLPKIANFFGISIDALVGADMNNEEEYVESLQEELRKYDMMRDERALVKCAESGLKKYPNNHLLMAWIVYGAQNINPRRSIELGEYLIKNCRDQYILNWVRTELCYAYLKSGRERDGIEAARHLPTSSQTRDAVLADILCDKDQMVHILENDIAKLCYRFKNSVLKLLNNYPPLLQIELLKKSNSMYDLIYETDDVVSALRGKADNCVRIAEIYAKMEDRENARLYIDKALTYAVAHDEIPYGTRPCAILCNCEKYNYAVMQAGKLAHPYGKLKDIITSSIKENTLFEDIISDI